MINSLPEAPVSSAAANAAGGTLVPGCMSMRNVSHFPPANAISELANAAPPLVTFSPLTNMVIGVANSVLIAGSIASIEIFLLREGTSMKRLVRLPFIVVILLKTLVYGGIVTAVVAGAARSVALMFPGRFDAAPLDPNTEP